MISVDPHCVFVHIPKTGGTSVAVAFLSRHGLTYDERAPLLMRPRVDESEGPPRLAHLTARGYVDHGHLSTEQWNAMFSFTFVRNPWSRAYSLYLVTNQNRNESFEEFVLTRLERLMRGESAWFVQPQCDFLECSPDAKPIDFVGRFETLAMDFAALADRLGISPDLPHENPSRAYGREATADKDARIADRYTDAMIEEIAVLYRRDVDSFGYRFADLYARADQQLR